MAFGILYGFRVCGIYKIRNTQNGNFYIGSSVNVEGRIFKHLSFLRRGVHPNAHLQAAFALYGEDLFEYELIACCDRGGLLTEEQRHIDAQSPAYNICRVAGNTLGYRHTDEAKAKMSLHNKGNQHGLGKKHTEEAKIRMSILASGRKASPETRAKLSQAGIGNKSNTGRKLPAEHVAKVADASLRMWSGEDKEQRRKAAADRAKAKWADPLWKAQVAQKIKDGKAARLARVGNHFGNTAHGNQTA